MGSVRGQAYGNTSTISFWRSTWRLKKRDASPTETKPARNHSLVVPPRCCPHVTWIVSSVPTKTISGVTDLSGILPLCDGKSIPLTMKKRKKMKTRHRSRRSI